MQKNSLYMIVFLTIFYAVTTVSAYSTPYIKEPMMCLNNMSVAPRVSQSTTKTIPTHEPTVTPTATPDSQPVVLTAPAATGYDHLFEKYAAEYGIKPETLSIIAKCESGYNPQALSSNQLYGGMFQFSSGTWQSNRANMGLDADPNLRFNAEESIRTAAFKISRDGVGAWNACGRKAL